jgi:HlyD family secretion protein
MRSRKRWIGWTAALVVVGSVATAAFWSDAEPVDVAPAVRSGLQAMVTAEARTRTRAHFVVTATVTGRLQRIRLRPGDRVVQGEAVASIAPLPMDAAAVEAARSRVAAALAAERDAEARVRQAREASMPAARAVKRYRALESAGAVSRQQCEDLELNALLRAQDLIAMEARARAAAAEVWAARAGLPPHGDSGYAQSIVVRAPAAGRVLAVGEESERVVAAGTMLLELGRDADLEIVADVLSEDAVRIRPGAAVELAGWGGDVVLHGTVRRVEPAANTRVSALGVDEQRVNVIISPNATPPGLGESFRLDARIVVWENPNALTVPTSAVFTVGGTSRVFVVTQGRASERSVRVGQRSHAFVEILDGLQEREDVVIFPSDRIRSGTRVRSTRLSFSPTEQP